MNKLTAADALDLSIPERIQLVEDIWDTIAIGADSVRFTGHDFLLQVDVGLRFIPCT